MSEAPDFEPAEEPDLQSAPLPAKIKKKTTADIYTMLLIIALLGILLGCAFLWAEIKAFGGFGTV